MNSRKISLVRFISQSLPENLDEKTTELQEFASWNADPKPFLPFIRIPYEVSRFLNVIVSPDRKPHLKVSVSLFDE